MRQPAAARTAMLVVAALATTACEVMVESPHRAVQRGEGTLSISIADAALWVACDNAIALLRDPHRRRGRRVHWLGALAPALALRERVRHNDVE